MAYNGPLPRSVISGGFGAAMTAGIPIGHDQNPGSVLPLNQYATMVTDGSSSITGAAPGLATQALVSNGAAASPSFGITGGAFAFIQSQTVSSPVPSVLFNTNISTIYNLYMLVYYNWSTDVTGRSLQIDFSNDGGATFPSGNYNSGGPSFNYNDTTSSAFNGPTTFRLSIANNFGGPGPRFNGGGMVYLAGLNSSRTAGVSNALMDAGVPDLNYGGGSKKLSNINAFKVSASGGSNITAGTFVLYGLRETLNPI